VKKRNRIAATAAAAIVAGQAAYSYKMINTPVPEGEEADAYIRSLLARMGMEELFNTWREEILPVGDNQLHIYHFESKPGDPVLVHVPGTSVYALLYTEFMYKLSRQGFNVVGIDMRGHGRSSGKRGVYTLGGLVDDTMAVIDYAIATYGDRAVVSGDSEGGMVAFYCAAAEPRLKAAVCHSVIANDEPDNYRMTRWPGFYKILMATLPVTQPLMSTPIGQLMQPVSAYLDPKAEECRHFPDFHKFLKEDPFVIDAISLGALSSLGVTPMARKVEEIETPVMVIHGGWDNIFPEDYVRRVYDRLTCEKEFLYLPQAPHLVMIDYVDEIVPPLAQWLKKIVGN
jgi:alpha-beta hydrolase superfamily lysophospholipase